MNIDMRTVVFLSVIIYITCTMFIAQLWFQNRYRFAGLHYWLINFLFQTAALALIVLRGSIPDWMSIVTANSLSIAGIIAGYTGLEHFIDRKSSQLHNYLLLVLFTIVHSYFIFVTPDLAVRNLNSSIGLLLVCFQCSWLLFRRVSPELRHLTFWTGMVFAGYCVVCSIRIIEYFTGAYTETDFFQSGTSQTPVFVAFQFLFITLTYSLILMVNRRLLMDISIQEEKFSKAFYSAPYAITLSRLSDGTMLDVNKRFLSMTGFSRSDVIGKKISDLKIWKNIKERADVIDMLLTKGIADKRDYLFRIKNGNMITGQLSAEIILINGENCILSSIDDVTDRREAEKRIKSLLAEKEIILKEVHHRIKNNMNTIKSLLHLQSEALEEPAAISALDDAGSRVQSMMVLYDKLYQSENINEVNIKDYLPALVDQIIANFPNSSSVKIEKQIGDFILDVKVLSAVGLIVNELLTNIMKYAFTGRTGGLITVAASVKNGLVSVFIQDNGNGIPETIDFENSTGFGLSLVAMLTKQLDGNIFIERGNGTKIKLEFKN